MIKIFPFTELEIRKLYTDKRLSAREIKEKLNLDVSVRQIQRILNKAGLIRTPGEAFRLAVSQGKVTYYHKPEHLKKKRKKAMFDFSDIIRERLLKGERANGTERIFNR
jgi:predicted transcriptional regulator